MNDKKIFNEDSLREMIVNQWGEYGAHTDVFDDLSKLAKGNIPEWMKNDWIAIDGVSQLPTGHWEVILEEEMAYSRMHTAHKSHSVVTIGGRFSFDVSKVIAYRKCRTVPENFK